MPYTYEYARPMLTVDIVPFSVRDGNLRVLLIRRRKLPFERMWAVPGGFVEMDEDLPDAARREMREETGLDLSHVEQLAAYGAPGRDPRGRTITIAYLGIVPGDTDARAGDDAVAISWRDPVVRSALAFDHAQIIADALGELRRRVRCGAMLARFLGESFTISQAAECAGAILGRRVSRNALRRRITSLGLAATSGHRGRYELARDAGGIIERAGGFLGPPI
jgi:8-oxo-dGTP diphosphatase